MQTRQLKNLYLVNKIENFQLRNVEDLLKVHGIDFKEVDGFWELNEDDKENFKLFLVNFLNVWGLNARARIVPLNVYRCFEENTSIKYDERFYSRSKNYYKLDSGRKKTLVYGYLDEEYKDKPIARSYSQEYLRFDYKMQDSDGLEWLHVIENGTQWY